MILFLFSPFGWVELGILDIRMLYICIFYSYRDRLCRWSSLTILCTRMIIWYWKMRVEEWSLGVTCLHILHSSQVPAINKQGIFRTLADIGLLERSIFSVFFNSENFWLHPGWKLWFKIFLLFLEAPLKHHRLWSNLAELNCVDLTLLDLKFFLSAKSF